MKIVETMLRGPIAQDQEATTPAVTTMAPTSAHGRLLLSEGWTREVLFRSLLGVAEGLASLQATGSREVVLSWLTCSQVD
ncbi:hypothetical protein [Streptomyces sp. NPDC001815]|uniref:hypothetical protein n=1 Tax=Streptomyces sp. NPDC001815 TaxID=3154526 RepID=UPI00332F1DA8